MFLLGNWKELLLVRQSWSAHRTDNLSGYKNLTLSSWEHQFVSTRDLVAIEWDLLRVH